MKLETMMDLYIHSLRDTYNAEKQLTKALPEMSKAANSGRLAEALTAHLEETKVQIGRIEEIMARLDRKPGGVVCHGMQGLVEEGKEMVDATGDPEVLDAGLIGAAQKAEHYEIAAYGCLCEFARMLGRKQDVRALELSLEEEKNADALLTSIAESGVNAEAMT